MNNQNRFLLPHQPVSSAKSSKSSTGQVDSSAASSSSLELSSQENEYQVDTDFDSYWEEEARNPHRNRIRIGRQYQATVPPLLKLGDGDFRKLDELETLSFCPKRSAKLSDSELDHYFTVAKSLNLFASLVETRSLLGRDVTIADLNHIRHKEGLSLASVIQPTRQSVSNANSAPQITQNTTSTSSSSAATGSQQQSPQKSPTNSSDINSKSLSSSTTVSSCSKETNQENIALNQPLMKALSHFISLHHPCYHNTDCKKLLKDVPTEEESISAVSITAGNLRCQTTPTSSPSKESKTIRSRSKQQNQASTPTVKSEESEGKDCTNSGHNQTSGGICVQTGRTYEDWTREEVELFSKAIEVCGKNFGSIKKEFLPSKSVRSIVEYYYIGSRDVSDSKKKPNQNVEAIDACNASDKFQHNNDGRGGSGGGGGGNLLTSGKSGIIPNTTGSTNSASSTGRFGGSNNTGKNSSDSIDRDKQVSTLHYVSDKINNNLKQVRTDSPGSSKSKSKNIDARMSIYNFDDEIKEDSSPLVFDCPRPGAEVRPLKAKPILPIAPGDGEAGNSNVGSLKFFMDGQLVLKLNACQEQQEGGEKCHWVQSGDKLPAPSRQKRFSKRSNDRSSDFSQNCSQSNSVVSSNHDDDSKNEDLTADEDSKESANSSTNIVTPRQKSFSASPTLKRMRAKTETNLSPLQGQQPLLTSPIDYNRLAVNNRMKEQNDNVNLSNNLATPLVDHAAAMPWIHANSFAMAAALLGGLPFPPTSSGLVGTQIHNNNTSVINMASKPMDLSVEHNVAKPIQEPKPSRSRSKQKN